MLTPEEYNRLESLCEMLGTEQFEAGCWELNEVKWLIEKLLKINNELRSLTNAEQG